MRKYALRVIACQWAVSKGFYELFNLLNNYVSIDDSWNLTLRVKRGLEDTSQVGGFLKDSLYLLQMTSKAQHLFRKLPIKV